MDIALAIGIPLGGGFLLGKLTQKNLDWYASLKKPSWRPPQWLFGPAWTTLYVLMGIASYRIYKLGTPAARYALAIYGLHLLVNFSWTPAFFHLKKTSVALVLLVILDFLLVWTIALFWKLDRSAGMLMVPVLAWCLFATALNARIVQLNS